MEEEHYGINIQDFIVEINGEETTVTTYYNYGEEID